MHGTSRAAAELDALGLTVILPPSAICFDLASAVERAEAIILDRDTAAGPGQEVDPAFAFEALGLPSDAVGPILALTTRTFFADGEPIIRSGDPSDAAYLLLSGEVLISIGTGGDKPAARLAVLEPGVLFGEAALLGQVCRTADATARGDASCLRIDGRLVERLRQQHPELAWHITAMLARQLTTHLRTANMTIAKLET
jgi:CRP-like cAMP-binding protein